MEEKKEIKDELDSRIAHKVWMEFKGSHIEALTKAENEGYRKGFEDGRVFQKEEDQPTQMLDKVMAFIEERSTINEKCFGSSFRFGAWQEDLRILDFINTLKDKNGTERDDTGRD